MIEVFVIITASAGDFGITASESLDRDVLSLKGDGYASAGINQPTGPYRIYLPRPFIILPSPTSGSTKY